MRTWRALLFKIADGYRVARSKCRSAATLCGAMTLTYQLCTDQPARRCAGLRGVFSTRGKSVCG